MEQGGLEGGLVGVTHRAEAKGNLKENLRKAQENRSLVHLQDEGVAASKTQGQMGLQTVHSTRGGSVQANTQEHGYKPWETKNTNRRGQDSESLSATIFRESVRPNYGDLPGLSSEAVDRTRGIMFKRKKPSEYGKALAEKHRLRGPGGAIIIYPDYESYIAAMQFSPARRAEVGIPAEDQGAFAGAQATLADLGFPGTILATGPVTASEFMGWQSGGWSYPRKVTAIVTETTFVAWWLTPSARMAYHLGLHIDMRPPFASDPGELAWTTGMCHDGIQDFRVENMGLLLDTDSSLQDGQAIRRGEEVMKTTTQLMPSHLQPNANTTILAEWVAYLAAHPKVEAAPLSAPTELPYIDYSDMEPPF